MDTPPDSAPITIRPHTDDDRELVRATVIDPAWLEAYRHLLPVEAMERLFLGREKLTTDYEDQKGEKLAAHVAVSDGRIVGMVGLGTYPGGEGEVRVIYVAPDCQGQGIGRRLWEFAVRELGRQGMTAVNVWTLAGADSCRFYEAMGCEAVGTGTLFLGEHPAPCVHYRRELGWHR